MEVYKHVMDKAYDEQMIDNKISTFLLNFFTHLIVSDAAKIDIDILRDNRTIAADVLRGNGQGNKNTVGKFSGKEYELPLFFEEVPITASMMNKRLPGIDPFTAVGQMATLAYWAAKGMVDITNKIIRAMEKMAAEALELGTVTLLNSDKLDFKRKATHIVTPSIKWDTADGDPLKDLEALADVIYKDGKIRPETVIFGSKAWQAFVNNAKIAKILDNRRIEVGKLAPGEVVNGARCWGAINVASFKFVIYIYDEFYDVVDGETVTHTPYITQDSVIMMCKDARLTQAFGAVEVLPQYESEYSALGMPSIPNLTAGKFKPFAYNLPPSALMAGIQSAPAVITTATDTIGCLTFVDSD